MAAAVSRRTEWFGRAAETAGRLLNRSAAAAATVPGLAGAGLVAYGAGEIYRPALFITGGLFLLLIDRRMPG